MMNDECREEITLVETDCLLGILENYLCKHKYKTKVKGDIQSLLYDFSHLDFVWNAN